MTTDLILLLPIGLSLLGAALAVLAGHPAINARLDMRWLGAVLALAPAGGFVAVLSQTPAIYEAGYLSVTIEWLPAFGLTTGLYVDSLAALFALIVSGIGVLVVLYAGFYFADDRGAWRFLAYMLVFMTAMLGLVMAGDLLTMFMFWEGTSITSFFLVAYKYKYEEARKGALQALLITGVGGIALLLGTLLVGAMVGNLEWATLLQSGDVIKASPLYPAAFLLLTVGAMTKSAQTPFHFWLPGAMSAPTPASAYLHSATMVKAGIYLLARLNPAMGNTELWFWVLSLVGLTTMLVGAWQGLRQYDLKALLAYSTIGQLGVLVMLIGQDTEIAFKALVVGILAHALYKSALFLVAGTVDHEAGTRDLRRLGGLGREMRLTAGIGFIATLSMAGLPPLFGFLAKETLLASVTHETLPQYVDWAFAGAVVLAGAAVLVQAAIFFYETFLGAPRDAEVHGHEAPVLMLVAPFIPALLSLIIGVMGIAPDLLEPPWLVAFLSDAAKDAYGETVKVSLALWTGFNIPFILSMAAITTGTVIFISRDRLRKFQNAIHANIPEDYGWQIVYSGVVKLADGAAWLVTRTQHGPLRYYLAVIIAAATVLVVAFGQVSLPPITLDWPVGVADWELVLLRIVVLGLALAASVASVALNRDLFAVLALGAAGMAVAVLMILEPAPDVALVQLVVDIMTTVVLVLALSHLPDGLRAAANAVTYRQSWPGLTRDLLVAGAGGALMTVLVFTALTDRPRESVITPYFEENAKTLTGATDIVGAIVVDFRAFDTLIEITVFSMAGVAVFTVLRYALKRDEHVEAETAPSAMRAGLLGIGGAQTSAFVHALAYTALPLALLVGATHMMYGHDQPGDGFTAGVIISLAVGFWYITFGYARTRALLPWLRPAALMAAGLLVVIVAAISGFFVNGTFFSPVDYGQMLGLPLPTGFNLSSSFLFEVSIALAVLGSAIYMIDTLGLPRPADEKEA